MSYTVFIRQLSRCEAEAVININRASRGNFSDEWMGKRKYAG